MKTRPVKQTVETPRKWTIDNQRALTKLNLGSQSNTKGCVGVGWQSRRCQTPVASQLLMIAHTWTHVREADHRRALLPALETKSYKSNLRLIPYEYKYITRQHATNV